MPLILSSQRNEAVEGRGGGEGGGGGRWGSPGTGTDVYEEMVPYI